MFYLTKRFRFEASHHLENHNSKCANNHGHSYKLSVVLGKSKLREDKENKNMVLCTHEISKVVDEMIEEYFDHKNLNQSLDVTHPTTEYVSKWIYDYLADRLDCLYAVEVFETETISVKYCSDNIESL
jgi:6-pyruvoyltetrahydropterin/6-carboxytetrahydropterin synthase